MSRILFDRFDDGIIILGIHHIDLGDSQRQNLLDRRFREGLEGARYGDFPVAHILDKTRVLSSSSLTSSVRLRVSIL